MKKIILIILGILALPTIVWAAAFNSAQVGSSPVNGYYLTTNGLVSTWAAVSGGGSSSGTWSTTTSTVAGRLINYPNNTTDIVTIGGSATTSSEFFFDPNTNISYFDGSTGWGTTTPNNFIHVASGSIEVSSIPASNGYILSSVNGIDRWFIRTMTTETGSGNVGADLVFAARTDAGGGLSNPVVIQRSTGDLGIGSTSPWAKVAITNTGSEPSFIVEDSTSPDSTPFIIDASGNVGVGTSTPWGTLSVFSGITTPAFVIATSTNLDYGQLFYVSGGNTVLSYTSSITSTKKDIGVRVGIGTDDYAGYGSLLDHLTVAGRIRSEGWLNQSCPSPGAGATAGLSADGNAGCGGYIFMEDSTATLVPVIANGYSFARLNASGPSNDGAGVWLNSNASGFMTPGTTTPVFEATVRISSVELATTTSFYVGYTTTSVTGNTFETTPTVGCYFTASSTQANWQAIARAGSTVSQTDIGIASSSQITGTGAWVKFRVEADRNGCYFYAQQPDGIMTRVATLNSNTPNQQMNAGVYYASISGGTIASFDVMNINTWWREVIPQL